MAEKPRLKKTGDILGSIAPEPARGKRAGARASDKNEGQARREQNMKAKSAEEDFFDADDENIELTDGPVLPSAQSLAEKLMPKKPIRHLDFKPPAPQPVKIEFDGTSDSGRAAAAPMEFQAAPGAAKPAAIEFSVNDAPEPEPIPKQTAPRASRPAPPQAQTAPKPAPPPVRELETPPVVAEYTFQSFEETKPAETADTVWEFSAQPQTGNDRGTRRGQSEQSDLQQQQQPRRERIIQPLRTETRVRQGYPPPERQQTDMPQQQQPQMEEARPAPPPPAPVQSPPPPPEPEISEAERNRQDFLKRIASQFEVQFEEKFEDGSLRARENMSPREPAPRRNSTSAPREPLFAPSLQPAIRQPESPEDQIDGEDFLSYIQRRERERDGNPGEPANTRTAPPDIPVQRQVENADEPALEFIEKFEKNVRQEEQQRSEDFKETISQKFMRERERYLKELQIDDGGTLQEKFADNQDVISPPAPTRRKLDFQIQPEMHMQPDKTAAPPNPRHAGKPASPMTYTRGGAATPQVDADDGGVTAARGFSVAPAPSAGGKKTGEQLLLEHSMRTRIPAAPSAQPAKLKFTFETPEEHAQKAAKAVKQSILPTEKWPRRIVLIAMAAGLFSLGLVGWSMSSYYKLSSKLTQENEAPVSEAQPESMETLDVYNDRVFTQTASVNNVVFKYAGTLLKNAHVKEYVLIEGVEGAGGIRLEDVTVDSAISVKANGVDSIELHNVKASRVIINNPDAGMTLTATGNTDIEVVELRTKSTVKQADIGTEAPGIRGMLVTSQEGGEIDARLDGLNLRTLETEAGTAILAFVNNTRAETMSANGSLSLSGDGRVSTLSVGAKIGQGAGDFDMRNDIIVFVKGVAVSNLNVKSPATLNLSTSVDSISTADALTIGGEAQIGSLTLNPNINYASRLLIDVVSANIQTVYANTQTRINVTGSSRINELTADDSTYALGNKVNHLKVNADGVIYENEPDNITLAKGIRPPQSKADNPNIDYNLVTAQPEQNPADVTGGDFATTCGHSRESGAFLVGDGSKGSPYEVSTALQLAHAGLHLASHFVQTVDIDISSESTIANNFPSIGSPSAPFEGVFDGKGFAISRLKILSQTESSGLFGANKGLIQNVRLYSGEISASPAAPGFAGGIAGLNYDGGQIRSCSNGANVKGSGNVRTGGIAGANYGGRIHDCYNYAKITGTDITGGVVGLNRQNASVTGSYNAGTIEGGDNAGAVAGVNEDGVIANCYYLDDSTYYGIGSGDGTATERTSEEMASPQMAADLSAGNESSLWAAGSAAAGYSYPMHRKPE